MNIWPRIKSNNLWLATLGGALLLMAVVVNRETDPPSTRLATPGYSYAVTSPLKGWLDPRLRRKPGETDMPLASRLNKEIFNARYHCDFRETSRLIENIAALTFRDQFREVGLLYPEHLCGFCHQSAYILSRAMTNNGIDAIPLGLNGHVVTLMSLDGAAWLFDPDFGLGPFEYGDAIWGDAEDHYRSLLGAASGFGQYEDLSHYALAYRTTDDDHPYYSPEWLERVEQQQRTAVATVEKASHLLGALGALLLALGLIRNRQSA